MLEAAHTMAAPPEVENTAAGEFAERRLSSGSDRRAIQSIPVASPASEGTPKGADDTVEAQRERMLLRKVRRGDERAFAEMVREHQDRVFDLVFRMLGDREEALDVSQEIFVSIHGAVARFRGDSRVSTWMFRIARNHCLNRLKYLGRRDRGRSTEISDVSEALLEAQAPSVRPDEAMVEREQKRLVQAAIAQLAEEHRLLVVLRDIEGLSYHEIAAIVDEPEGTVKSRLHRARAALAEIVVRLEQR
jgi:RNA polymerase sigma-70 factor (ECF subfamily)